MLLQTPNHYRNSERNSINQNQQAKQKDYTDELITSLKSEITFLREELLSEDSIIKLLINDSNKCIDKKTKEVVNHFPNPVGKRNANSSKSSKSLDNNKREGDKAGDTKSLDEDFNTQKKS